MYIQTKCHNEVRTLKEGPRYGTEHDTPPGEVRLC